MNGASVLQIQVGRLVEIPMTYQSDTMTNLKDSQH